MACGICQGKQYKGRLTGPSERLKHGGVIVPSILILFVYREGRAARKFLLDSCITHGGPTECSYMVLVRGSRQGNSRGYGRCLERIKIVKVSVWEETADFGSFKSGPVIDLGVEYLHRHFDNLRFTSVISAPKTITTCDLMERRAAYITTRYYFESGGRDSIMAFFGPGWNVPVFSK
ncbi:hypothetical protein RvY_05633 [Ramazzottius varieornatus]|uniref:Uncharacterized protein n=1 Tax=Ramazzottius varieornatus TaxID=947166 RepID=A0A1D1UW90_RAMVA|nr:hypothetical protein RvY_05633 [Ramazzottius varieornatus]